MNQVPQYEKLYILEENGRREEIDRIRKRHGKVTKAKDIRNTIECETKDRIETNHLKENWSVIPIEITTFFNIRLTNFEYEVHTIIDETLYNVVFNLFKNRIFECRDIIMQLLESLKDDGEEEPELYEAAVRQLEAHMKKFETDLINDVKELLG